MGIGAAGHRSNDDALVQERGDAREALTDFDAGDDVLDRIELAADFAGSVGLDLPHVLMGRSAPQEDIDYRLMLRFAGL